MRFGIPGLGDRVESFVQNRQDRTLVVTPMHGGESPLL